MRLRSRETLAVVAVVVAVVVVGCSGGYGPTLPSPDGSANGPINDTPINDTPTNDTPVNDTPINDAPDPLEPTPSSICGQVYTPTGNGYELLTNATVTLTDGFDTQVDVQTDAEGRFCHNDLEDGFYAIAVRRQGYRSELFSLLLQEEGAAYNVEMEPVDANPTACPTFNAWFGISDQAEGTGKVTGRVMNTDADQVVVLHYRFTAVSQTAAADRMMDTSGDAAQVFNLDRDLPLVHGGNRVKLFAANANCAVLSEPMSLIYEPNPEAVGGADGRLVDGQNRPIADVVVTLEGNGTTFIDRTYSDGTFGFRDIYTGTYIFTNQSPEHDGVQLPVRIVEGVDSDLGVIRSGLFRE